MTAHSGIGHNHGLVDDALAAAGVGLCNVDSTGRFSFDDASAAKFGLPHTADFAEVIAHVGREHRRDIVELVRAIRGLPQQRSTEFRVETPGGAVHWVRAIVRRMTEHCEGDCGIVTLIDVTADRNAIDALRQSEEHLRYTVEYNPQLPWIADPMGRIIDVTDRWLAATGMTRETALGEGWGSVTHPGDLAHVNEQIVLALTTGNPFDVRMRLCVDGHYRWMRAQGYPRRDDRGEIIRWYGYTEDIHEQVLVENQIRWNAEHDPLTGLANRLLFNTSLEKALAAAVQCLHRVGVLLIDLDHFKEVNDLLGHHAGDALLQHYADELRSILPQDVLVARLGGDEFAILFTHLENREELVRWGEEILNRRQDFSLDSGPVDCRASIGAALFPDHGQQSSELLRHADIALYAAKDGGRGKMLIFESRMQDEVRERAAMVARARTAAKSGDILAFYQPKVSLVTGELTGFEALLRWRDSMGNIHAPASIMAAFEEAEVADLLGQTMLAHVIADIAKWKRMGLAYGHVAINAAPAEFRQNNFAPRLIASMREAGLHPRDIEVEITEGVFLGRGADHAKDAIYRLSENGTSIVLDDFGTGFASLSHLRALPVDMLKIDRSFVSHIDEANGDAAIVSAIVNLGRNLGIKVIAEGIETLAQADVLRSFGCEYAQGYYFGVPTPAAQIPDLIRRWPSSHGGESRTLPSARSA
ncbi:EAL domain-containing protein [Sphingobium sufflavum]|uniref:putative bifunctional diguanylate cyclase/phosphodiesterase n=1 Tax=Sphingobium sufflavum TaxID=1129547 RepID=UPI001F1DEE51|nr:EAL domain-containing protein [Sphingobium sufflavum]MCE7797099.1 EAL domain-containing protein [Sphingobium sufflavum]